MTTLPPLALDEPTPPRPQSHLVRGSTWLMAGFAAHALTGLVFWLLAAHLFSSADVGRAAALFASLQFVNYATAMGLQEMLARFHPAGESSDGGLFAWSVVVTTATSALGTAGYLSLVSSARDVLAPLGAVRGGALFFAISTGAAVALLGDVQFMAMRRWRWVFWRLLLVGALRLPALWLPSPGDEALWLFLVMAAPLAISGAVSIGLLRASGLGLALRPLPSQRRTAARYAGVNYLAHLALFGPHFGLPVLVLTQVGATDYANFFLAWSIAAVAAILPTTIARVLVVEASRTGADLLRHANRALVLALGVMGLATLAAFALSPVIVSVYGETYRDASELLPVLMAAGIPWAVTAVALGHSRVRHDPLGTIAIPGVLAASILGLAIVFVPSRGADGAALAWLVGNVVASAAAIAMWRRARTLPIAVARPPELWHDARPLSDGATSDVLP